MMTPVDIIKDFNCFRFSGTTGGEQAQKAFTDIVPPAADASAVADANRQGGRSALR
jgi:hypothetical protein